MIQIVDAALADSARRSGALLACRPGCSQCCVGAFAINQLDAARLRAGLSNLELRNPARATRLKERVASAISRFSATFPGDPQTGLLDEKEDVAWENFANDEPCPVLDPVTGTCELYEYRPVICRTFGPPIMEDGDLGVCELCYDGATEEQIAACEMKPDPENLEDALLKEFENAGAPQERTTVAFCLGV